MFLPYGRHSIDDDDIKAVVEVLQSNYLTTGPAVEAFETALRSKLDVPHVISCINGTAALHMASAALGIGPDDVVIVPTITFLATANGPALTGAQVVFADVDSETGLLTPQSFEEALVRARAIGHPKAVLPVHLNGQCAPMAELSEIAQSNNLLVIEDASHAIGGRVTGPDGNMTPVGSCVWSDAATFSFHPVKTIAMGEGGAVSTRDPAVAERLRLFRNHGMTRDAEAFANSGAAFDSEGNANPWYYEMQTMGHNFRAPDINCALGLSQLGKLDLFVAKRRKLMARYDSLLQKLAPLVRPIPRMEGQEAAWHIYVVQIDFDKCSTDRSKVMNALRDRNIGTQVHYIPVSSQPYWKERADIPVLQGAERYYNQVLTLPMFTGMSEQDVDLVVQALEEVLR